MEQGERQESQEQAQELQQQLGEMRKSVDKMRESFLSKKKNEIAKKMEEAAAGPSRHRVDPEEDARATSRARSRSAPRPRRGFRRRPRGRPIAWARSPRRRSSSRPTSRSPLGRALANQSNAVGRYSNQDLAGGLVGSKESTIALNQAAAGLLRQRDSMQASKSSTGMQEAMERLQSLAGRAAGPEPAVDGDDAGREGGQEQEGNSGPPARGNGRRDGPHGGGAGGDPARSGGGARSSSGRAAARWASWATSARK